MWTTHVRRATVMWALPVMENIWAIGQRRAQLRPLLEGFMASGLLKEMNLLHSHKIRIGSGKATAGRVLNNINSHKVGEDSYGRRRHSVSMSDAYGDFYRQAELNSLPFSPHAPWLTERKRWYTCLSRWLVRPELVLTSLGSKVKFYFGAFVPDLWAI